MPAPSSTATASVDTATVIAAGVLAATLAAICHEALGHGLGCLGTGGRVTLLTSIWFRCSKWSAITDAGGPLGNLLAGSLAVVLLGYTRQGATARLLLLLLGALNLFWFMGQLTFESLSNRHDDWYWVLQMGRPGVWRTIGSVVGIGGYVIVGRVVSAINSRQHGPNARGIRLGYAAAAVSAVLAGLMWRPEPFRTAFEGFLTLGIAPLGLLSIAARTSRDAGQDVGARSVPRSWILISISIAAFAVFLFVQARGVGSMAASRLSP